MSILERLTRRNFGIVAGMMTAVGLSAGSLITLSANAAPMLEAGATAPAIIDAVTSTGETISLSDFVGKTVVLEWTNMQNLQADAADDEIIWMQVISSAPGKQGYTDGAGAIALNTARGSAPAYTIMDPTGVIGRAYGAKTTPHMYVINGDRELVYSGAIDSVRSAKVEDIEGATNFVTAALDAIEAGEAPAVKYHKEYGCSVKY